MAVNNHFDQCSSILIFVRKKILMGGISDASFLLMLFFIIFIQSCDFKGCFHVGDRGEGNVKGITTKMCQAYLPLAASGL